MGGQAGNRASQMQRCSRSLSVSWNAVNTATACCICVLPNETPLGSGIDDTVGATIECLDASLDKTVKQQDPAAGAQVPGGTIVTLVVYKFKPSDPSCVSPPPT